MTGLFDRAKQIPSALYQFALAETHDWGAVVSQTERERCHCLPPSARFLSQLDLALYINETICELRATKRVVRVFTRFDVEALVISRALEYFSRL